MFWYLRNLTITQRLLALTALAMLPAAAVVIFYILSLHQQRERDVHALALQYGQLASLEMERIVTGAEGVLRTMTHVAAVRSFDAERCQRYLAAVHADLPQFLALAVADTDGNARCASTSSGRPVEAGDSSYVDHAIETGGFVVGTFTRFDSGEYTSLPVAMPIVDGNGSTTGVIIAGLDLNWLGRRLRERNLLEDSSLTVADRNGVIIAREPLPDRFVGTRIPEPYQELVRGERPGTLETTSQDGVRRVLGYYPPAFSRADLYVSFGLATETVFGAINTSIYQSIAIALIGMAAVFIIAWIAGEQLFRRPIRRLLDTISAWRKGDDSARTGISGGSELAVLAAAIDEYMDDLVAGRAARRRAEEHRTLLVHELDHRVKNILATVQAIASQTFRNEASRAGLDAFSGRLSAMASTHEMLMSENWETAELRRTMEIAVKPFDDVERRRFAIYGPPLLIRARGALALSMAVHELCTNAVKYGALRAEKGRVTIEWSIEEREERDVFVLSWTERDGPVVKPPKKKGFGTRMIQRALASELSANVDLRFPSTGLQCTLECAVASIIGEDGTASREKAA